MSHNERIEWNGQLVGHLQDIETETFDYRTSKLRGRWVPLQNQVAQDFLRQCEEHLRHSTLLFRLGAENLPVGAYGRF